MLLSHKHNFLFVHIAKTGGTSVRAALMKHRWGHRYSMPMFIANKLSHLTSHKIGSKFPRHSKIIAAQEMLPNEFFNSLTKFAFVRNPWDLQVSSYHHIKRERPHVMQGKDDFDSFMRWKFDETRPYQYHIDTSLELQSDYLIDLKGQLLTNFIGRYENLHDDFAQICSQIGLAAPTLPHKRKAQRDSYQKYYTDETAELVAKHFQQDIKLLGYQFDE